IRPRHQRGARLEVPDLRLARVDLGLREVWRIGYDQVPRALCRDLGKPVGAPELHAVLQAAEQAVLPSELARLLAAVAGDDLGARQGEGERERDGARARPQIEDTVRPVVLAEAAAGDYDRLLVLGPRDARAPVDLERKRGKPRLAQDVLARLAARAAGDFGPHVRQLALDERAVELHVELHAVEPERGGDEPLGVEARVFDALGLEEGGAA